MDANSAGRQQHIDELSQAEGMASLAADVVYAAAVLQEGIELDEGDIRSLRAAHDLLTGVATVRQSAPPAHLLLSSAGPVDLFDVLRSQKPRREPEAWARELAETLLRAAQGSLEPSDDERLTEVRGLFSLLAQLAVPPPPRAPRAEVTLQWTGS